MSQKKMEEGSSGRKKWKRKEEEEIEAELGLVVEELWRRVVRKWEESEWQQEHRWAAIMATLGHITEDVQELLDGLVPEEKEKGKEKGVETEAEEMETEEAGVGTERDGEGNMEVEETLKEAEKSADEAERVEKRCNGGVEKSIIIIIFACK